MKSYHLAWAFFLTYDHRKQRLELKLSETFQEKHHMNQASLIFEHETLKACIHKYDYRKLAYFSEGHSKTFDTQLRFKLKKDKTYLKTQAICQALPHGFECVLIEEKVLFETSKSLSKSHKEDIELEFLAHHDVKNMIEHGSLIKMKHQLNTFFERQTI